MVRVAGSGDAKRLPHDDRAPGVRRLIDGGERADALADRALLFGGDTDEEAGVVDEVHERQAEGVAEVDEARHLFGGGGIDGAGVEGRVVRHHADGDAVEAREPGDERLAEVARDLEEGAGVHDELDDPPHLVDAPAVSRDEGDELLLAALRVVGRLR